MHKKIATHQALIFLLGVMLWGGLLSIFFLQKKTTEQGLLPVKNSNNVVFSEVEKILNDEYFYKENLLNEKEAMLQWAIKWFVDALGDPHTLYLDSEQNSGLNQELEGESDFEGIGAVIEKKEYYIQIAEVLKNSPAFKAWLQPLDRIILIWTWETKDLDVYEAVKKISWPKGTTVDLWIERPAPDGQKKYLELTVTRELIQIPSIKYHTETINGKTIWVLEILVFWEKTEKLLNEAIGSFIDEKIDGIILDLRGNGGGLLLSAVDIAKHFLEKGKLVVSTQYRSYNNSNYFSRGIGELSDFPTIILIDWLTASAWEILALALHDNLNIPILGTKSFGKGSIQTIQDFPNWTALKYTVGNRYSPLGENINGTWIIPDFEVIFDLTGYINSWIDNQLESAKTKLFEQIQSSNSFTQS